MGQIPATGALGSHGGPIRWLRKTSVIVVGCTYRFIHITSPSQYLRNLENLPRTTPGSQNLALERRNEPNPCDRCIGEPWRAHKMATEDKCDSSWVYLSSYSYISPAPPRISGIANLLPRYAVVVVFPFSIINIGNASELLCIHFWFILRIVNCNHNE